MIVGLGVLFTFLVLRADDVRETVAVAYPQGSSTRVVLDVSDRLPGAGGAAEVSRRDSATQVRVELLGLKPATLFGGDYNTYVLWAVSPDGQTANLGEIVLNGTRGTLQTATALSTFSLIVTAEPHFLVNEPSAFLVLENRSRAQGSPVRYHFVRGVYNFERSTLEGVKEASGPVDTNVKQAFTAVRLAQHARGAELASLQLAEAQQALDETFRLLHQGRNRIEVEMQARETVHLAVTAQSLAQDRALEGRETERSGGGNSEPHRRDLPRVNE